MLTKSIFAISKNFLTFFADFSSTAEITIKESHRLTLNNNPVERNLTKVFTKTFSLIYTIFFISNILKHFLTFLVDFWFTKFFLIYVFYF